MTQDANNEVTSHIFIFETLDESPNTLECPANTANHRETLYQRSNEDKHPALMKAEFQDLLEDLETLKNYCEQLQETKQALQKSETILNKILKQTLNSLPAPKKSRRTVQIPDPPLFDGSSKDRIGYDNWLIQIIYTTGHTSDEALALILSQLNTVSCHVYTSLTELYEHLNELYDNLNKKRNDRQAFKNLIMKKGQTFQEFYPLFLQYIADSNISP
ncbi:MAG: hypothetical protein M1839_001777 [Geoglossum umbratile]|nr:MAG: hypothetical protein M1839_001777 [Geoglossum umbratile]